MNLAMAKKKILSMSKALRGSSVNLTDYVAKGYLTIHKEFADGTREMVLDNDPNVITYASRRHHLAFLYDTNVGQDILSAFKVGSGGAIGSDTGGNTNIKVLSPDPKRNSLYKTIPLVNSEITITASDPSIDEVYITIQFTLSQDEANGTFINECGLFKDGGDMFNHKTFLSIPKSESFSLIFSWKIRYV